MSATVKALPSKQNKFIAPKEVITPFPMRKTKEYNSHLAKKLSALVTLSSSPDYQRRKEEREELVASMLL